MSLQKWLFDSPKLSVGAQQAGYDSKSNITCQKRDARQLLKNPSTPKPLEEIKHRQDMDVIPERGTVTQVDAVTSCFALTQGFPDPVQTAVVALVPARCGLDLNGDEACCRLAERVHFRAIVVAPEIKWVVFTRITEAGA